MQPIQEFTKMPFVLSYTQFWNLLAPHTLSNSMTLYLPRRGYRYFNSAL